MVTRTLAAFTFGPIFLAIILFGSTPILGLTLGGILATACAELLQAGNIRKKNPLYPFTVLSAAMIPVLFSLFDILFVLGCMALLLVLSLFSCAISAYGTKRELTFEHISLCFFAGIVFPTFLSCLIPLHLMDNGPFFALLPVGAAFATDSGAYFAGVTLGKHRGITRVSPNKSLEGYIGGILFDLFIFLLYGFLLSSFTSFTVHFQALACYAIVGGLVTELGDLSFSLIKRQKDVKDFGHLIPGHGGMLDRFDSMIFSAPTLLLLVTLYPAF